MQKLKAMNRNEIWQAVELELRRVKKLHPNWPDHICGCAGEVVKEAGNLMKECSALKYECKKDEEAVASQKELIRFEAIYLIATTIRFLENLK